MAEFAYNNAKNVSTGYTLFELNCGYHLYLCYEEDINPRSKFKSADELSIELQELMTICRETYTTLKNFRSKLTIKTLSLRAMPWVIKFG